MSRFQITAAGYVRLGKINFPKDCFFPVKLGFWNIFWDPEFITVKMFLHHRFFQIRKLCIGTEKTTSPVGFSRCLTYL